MNKMSPIKLIFYIFTGIAIAATSLLQLSNASPQPIQLSQSQNAKSRATFDTSQTKALIEAVTEGDLASVKAALLRKANPNAKNKQGTPVLVIAAFGKNLKIVKLLLAYNADVEGREPYLINSERNDFYTSPLMGAAKKGQIEMLQLLLRKGANVNISLDEGETALDVAIEENHTDVVKILLESGANPNHYSPGGTPLFYAARKGYAKIVSLLIEHGADINADINKAYSQSSDKKTPLTPLAIAIQYKQLKVVELLRKAGAK
jgi:uncharacterized protein